MCHFFQQMQEIFGFEGQVTWGAAHDLKCYCLSPILKCLCNASKVCFSPPTYFSPPSICLADVAVSLIQSSSLFSYLNTSLNQYLPRSSSQCRPQVPAPSPLPILRSTQQHAVNNLQHSTAHNHTLVPVYVYLEHLAASNSCSHSVNLLSWVLIWLLNPRKLMFRPPLFPSFKEQVVSMEATLETSLSMTWLRLCLAYPCPAPTFRWPLALAVRHIAPIYLLHLVPLPPPAARHSPTVSLQINTVPSLSRQASPTKKKYYSVTIGKKTGVFWDEW